jgi:RNA polymerase-associated protein RTF1
VGSAVFAEMLWQFAYEFDRKRTRTNSPHRSRSSSPMDMEMSDDESEDGQITKMDQEEERRRGVFGNGKESSTHAAKAEEISGPLTAADLKTCWLSRRKLLQHAMTPWFEEFVRGAYTRYMIGPNPASGLPKYRICEIIKLVKGDKPYKVDDALTDDWLELKIGASSKVVKMDLVSNTPFDESEFEKWTTICLAEKVKPPTRADLERKHAQIEKWNNHSRTEADITAIINRKRLLSGTQNSQSLTLERSRLTQARNLAQRRQDYDEVAELDAKLQELQQSIASASPSSSQDPQDPLTPAGLKQKAKNDLAAVNERNRLKNMEAIRKMEIAEAERKRRERKAAMEAANGAVVTPTPVDPSARLKTMARIFSPATPASRPSTPAEAAVVKQEPGTESMTPMKPVKNANTSFLATIDVDLGDF